MKPPFTLNSKILNLCSEISLILGQFTSLHFSRPKPKLRKSNRIRTIQSSLAIEGNTLAQDQVTAILDGKKVLGSQREIIEVQNAIKAYDQMPSFKPHSSTSLREAHRLLMTKLVAGAGKWRTSNVGIFRGKSVAHAAPQAKMVPELMEQLFSFIKKDTETHPLILSAIFHYELEFIHPFMDGNGRIGRLWQSTLLFNHHPIFEFTPIESAVRERQGDYYEALGHSDQQGNSTPFIEFSLETILNALKELQSAFHPTPLNAEERLMMAQKKLGSASFSRKDYLDLFKTISTATASRDLALGVKSKTLKKKGEKTLARYHFLKKTRSTR